MCSSAARSSGRVQVFLRPEQLQSYRVGVDQVIAAIQAANQDLPAGSISTGTREQLVRVEGKIKDPRGFERIIVANQGGAPVYLSQVADIVDGEAEELSIARVNGTALGLGRHLQGSADEHRRSRRGRR